MLRLLADENLDANIVRGLLRRVAGLDIVRVQDVATITRYAWERVEAGLPMPGVVEVVSSAGVGAAIEDLVLLLECCQPDELENVVLFVPL
jgi:hypothetical protein